MGVASVGRSYLDLGLVFTRRVVRLLFEVPTPLRDSDRHRTNFVVWFMLGTVNQKQLLGTLGSTSLSFGSNQH